MALTQISTQGIKDGTITGTDLATNIDLVDNQKLRLGNNQNLQIYYDASSYITNSTAGHLIIKTINGGSDINLECADDFFVKTGVTQNSIIARDSGQVELYYSGSKKFETLTNGAKIHGIAYVQAANDVDSVIALYADNGDDNDDKWRLKSTATGSNFTIDNFAGGAWETSIKAVGNGQVELYHNNVKKFETTSTGVTVTGEIHSTSHIDIPDNAEIRVGTGDDLRLFHDGTNSIIDDAGVGALSIRSDTGINILKRTLDEFMLKAIPDGAVELYHDNSKKFETKSTGVRVTGNVHAGPSGTTFATDNSTYVFQAAAPSQAYVSTYAANDGTNLFNHGFHFGIDTNSANLIVRESKPIRFYTNDGHRLTLQGDGHLVPAANNTFDLGSTSNRWRNIYTNDLNLSNEGSSNDVDGTWGSYTIQEGAEDLFLVNKRSGKKYKFNLTEVS